MSTPGQLAFFVVLPSTIVLFVAAEHHRDIDL